MPQMLFPDPRFRSPTAEGGFGRFGLTYACDDVRNAQAALKVLLDQAVAAKLLIIHWFTQNEGHPTAVAAQSVYDNIINMNLVIESDDACATATQQLNDAAASLQALLNAHGTGSTDYTPPSQNPYTPGEGDTLEKLKPLFIAGAVGIGLLVLAPVLLELVGYSKVLRKRKFAGRRRR